MCYRALTGEGPDEAPDRVALDPLVPASERCAGQARVEFLSAIDWALQMHKENRPQSIAEWRIALETGSSVNILPTGPPPTPPSQEQDRQEVAVPLEGQRIDDGSERPKKPKGKLIATVACLLAVLIGGVYYYQYEYIPNQRLKAQEIAEAKVASEREAKVLALLSGAEEDLARDRLTSPGANAWEKYQAVLSLEPGHKMASAGLDSIIGRYVSKFDASLGRKEFEEAKGYMSRIQSVYADAPVLSELEDRLSGAREAERQSKMAEYEGKFEEALGRNDFDMADKYVDSLRAVNADGAMVSRLTGRLSEEIVIEQYWQALLAAGDEEMFEEMFEEALGDRNYDKADRYVDSLRAVNVDGSVLSELSGRLSAVREADPPPVGRKFRDCARMSRDGGSAVWLVHDGVSQRRG